MLASVFVGRIAHYVILDMDGLVEVEGIEPCVLLTQFAEKQVFIMFCCFLNFSIFFLTLWYSTKHFHGHLA